MLMTVCLAWHCLLIEPAVHVPTAASEYSDAGSVEEAGDGPAAQRQRKPKKGKRSTRHAATSEGQGDTDGEAADTTASLDEDPAAASVPQDRQAKIE